ncbi:phage tail tape measure protein [Bosea sp. BIWAKO-01]|uniref:phage tail tape measure protein n=1 Tax=Bosea sp. BIWAKO-01 TaxID=506668 RepID=UPI00086DFD35|nr:phage tail tape measure protein [Bosea sp. BIWAKO-01]GAU85181.1 TP901 family phage tail tape measure protein [Bosea sp. BIWAKO-01]
MADMKARAIIEAVDKTGKTFSDIAGKMKAVDKAAAALGKAKGMKGMAQQVDAVAKSLSKVSAIDAFRGSQASFAAARTTFREAQANVSRLAAEMARAKAPTAALSREFAKAQREVRAASTAFEAQKSALIGNKRALEQTGVSLSKLAAQERGLRAATMQTTAALERRQAALLRSQGRRDAAGNLLAMGGLAVGAGAKSVGKKSVVSVAEFDIASRKQREFTDISEAAQRKGLLPQAKRIGQDTQFSNLDIVKAQTKAMQGLPSNITGDIKAEVGEGIIENVKNYALVMEADMEQAAEAIRSYLQSTGKDISTKEKALFEANKATNQLVKMAKLGGMSDEDVQQYIKYAAASGTAAGLTPESMMSIAAVARRAGLRGDEAGTFMRSTASKLVAPTKDGLAALNAAGIDHNKFVRMPSALDVNGLQGQFRNGMGLNFTPETRANLEKVLADKSLIGDRGKFTTAVTEAIEGQMPKTKKGTMKPADRVNVAKAAGKFHQMSAESVDAEGLLDAVMNSKMTLAQLNAFLTNKHGGKGAITAAQREEYVASRKELNRTGDDPNFAKNKADSIMAGVGGSYEQAKGAIDNFVLSIGEANKGLIKFGLDGFSTVLDSFGKLSTEGQQAATAVAAAGAAYGAGVGALKLSGLLTGGAALSGSAAALDASAAALTAAAAKLSGGSVVPEAVKKSVPAVAAGVTAAGVASVAAIAAGAAIIVNDYKPAAPGVTKENAAPGQAHDDVRSRRRAFHEKLRAETQAVKATVEGPVTATLEGQANVNVSVKVDGGTVTGMSSTSSGNVKASVGTSMGHVYTQ